jgi:peptidoglycan/xylan/chitin deacetylase (PgdA/CDA1 family)
VPYDASQLGVSIVLYGNGSVASREYALDDITKSGPATWTRPLVSITFDDGWNSTFTNALPVLNRYDYKGTFYVNPSSIETPKFMSAAELMELSDTRHEIAAHGYSHVDMTTINSEALGTELRQGQTYLTNAGFSTTDFAAPYGKSDAEVQWYARKYFSTLRSVEAGINTRQNFDPYNLKVLFIKSDTSQQTIAAALNEAKQINGWLILVYHKIGSTKSDDNTLKVENDTVATTTFADQITAIQKSNIAVLPVENVYEEVVNQ